MGILLLFGFGFMIIHLIDIIEVLTEGTLIELEQFTPWVVDFTVAMPVVIVGGLFIILKKLLGFVLSPGLLLYLGLLDFRVTILYVFK